MIVVYFFLYVISWCVHVTWILWGSFFIGKIISPKKEITFWSPRWKHIVAVIICWVMIDLACRGCPFFYAHEYLEVKMGWRTHITYKFEDSYVYQWFVEPLK